MNFGVGSTPNSFASLDPAGMILNSIGLSFDQSSMKGGTRWETKARRIKARKQKIKKEDKETRTNGKKESGETTDKNPCIETMGERYLPRPPSAALKHSSRITGVNCFFPLLLILLLAFL